MQLPVGVQNDLNVDEVSNDNHPNIISKEEEEEANENEFGFAGGDDEESKDPVAGIYAAEPDKAENNIGDNAQEIDDDGSGSNPNPPTFAPTVEPSAVPSLAPNAKPTMEPSVSTSFPSFEPTEEPTLGPTFTLKMEDGKLVTSAPSFSPTFIPSEIPTVEPTIPQPTMSPTNISDAVKSFEALISISATCPGVEIFRGVSDPREIAIKEASLMGLGGKPVRSVELKTQLSEESCHLGSTYGMKEGSDGIMWTSDGCRGTFITHPDNQVVECYDSSANASNLTRTECSLGAYSYVQKSDKGLEARSFLTGEFNMHRVDWIIATFNEKSIHMVRLVVTVHQNIVLGCAAEAGLMFMNDEEQVLDYDNVMKAWAGRSTVAVAESDDSEGIGIAPGLQVQQSPISFFGHANKYQSMDFIPNDCPGGNATKYHIY